MGLDDHSTHLAFQANLSGDSVQSIHKDVQHASLVKLGEVMADSNADPDAAHVWHGDKDGGKPAC